MTSCIYKHLGFLSRGAEPQFYLTRRTGKHHKRHYEDILTAILDFGKHALLWETSQSVVSLAVSEVENHLRTPLCPTEFVIVGISFSFIKLIYV